MGPNDADIVRVFTRAAPDGAVSEEAFPSNADFEVVVEVEAGSAIFATGALYEVGLAVIDYTGFNLFPIPVPAAAHVAGTPNIAVADHMITGKWTTQTQSFVYTVSHTGPPNFTTREGHFCEVLASLRVGAATPDMSFARSGLFIIFKP